MSEWLNAQIYVGNVGEDYQMAGILQLELLRRNGLLPAHHVLEIGCGALVAGRPIMQYLAPDRYVGIEPNTWLIEASRKHFPDSEELFLTKRPVFSNGTEFDASSTKRTFDYVISHSILSHAAHQQLPTFMENCSKVLGPYGIIIASIRFRDDEGRVAGDGLLDTWQYPGVNFFSLETVVTVAERYGLVVEQCDDYRDFFMEHSPRNHHDWIRMRWRTDCVPHLVSA